MAEAAPALPEWISPPGSIVARILDRRQVTLDDFAVNMGLSSRKTLGLIEGTVSIDAGLAKCLASVIGSSQAFWLRCERSYREDTARNIGSYVNSDVKTWMKRLPLKELAELGWIQRHKDPIRQAQECFQFFGVISLDDWKRKQIGLLSGVNFRTSLAFQSEPAATSAWLRWAENQAEDAACGLWNRNAFADSLDEVRTLSRNHHPKRFVPQLKEICAAAGVAVVIAPAPKGCTANGATRLIRDRKAMIALSFRYYSDDQFWFTFLHEAGHLVKHADQELFLEDDEDHLDDREHEANSFAFETLIPFSCRREMLDLPTEYGAYISFAREIGIAPGIVVGQMQRLGHLPYARLNKLKRRFEWKTLYQDGVIP